MAPIGAPFPRPHQPDPDRPGHERLAELLLELAGSDPAINRRIRLAVANAASPEDAAAHLMDACCL